mmetsp:Transcript_38543/g.68967  ORF Transcript_38543/g.68967 Transcript_38543/m.68967 type:complete len:1246 (-) Transcript_38543:304-4041(-)
MANMDIGLESVDVAVEDLLKVEVTYGRLSLVLKSVLEKLRAQTDLLNALRNEHNDLKKSHDDLQSRFTEGDLPPQYSFDNQAYVPDQALKASKTPSPNAEPQDDAASSKAMADEQSTTDLPEKSKSPVRELVEPANMSDVFNQHKQLSSDLQALKDRVRRLERRPRSAPDASATPPAPLVELDDSILDDVMANHHRRLRLLEDEQKEKFDSLLEQFGLPPLDIDDASPKFGKILENRHKDAILGITLYTALELQVGKGSATTKFILNTPASGGDVRLKPVCDGLAFDPAELVVRKNGTESNEVKVTATDVIPGELAFITVHATPEKDCDNNMTCSPFAVSGIIVKPIPESGAATPTSVRSTGSAKSASSRKSSGDKEKSMLKSKPKDSSPRTGPAIRAIQINKPLTVEAQSSPFFFVLDNPAAGGCIMLTPSARGCTFTPAQVVVPAGCCASGSVAVTASNTAAGGPLALMVKLDAHPLNQNQIDTQMFKVEGITINPETGEARATNDTALAEAAKAAAGGTVGKISLSVGTTVIPSTGEASQTLCFILDTPATGGSIKLIPSGPGLQFAPASIEVPQGHTLSQPFIVHASAMAPRRSILINCACAANEENTNKFASKNFSVVGLTVVDALDSYRATGASPNSERLLRSGLSERLRSLTNDHERRIKLLESRFKAALQALRNGGKKPVDLDSRLSALEDALKAGAVTMPQAQQNAQSGDSSDEKIQDILARLEALGGRVQTHDDGIMDLDKATKDHSDRIGALESRSGNATGVVTGRTTPSTTPSNLQDLDLNGVIEQLQSNYKDLDARIMREAQNIAILNTKVNTLAGKIGQTDKLRPESRDHRTPSPVAASVSATSPVADADDLTKQLHAVKLELQDHRDFIKRLEVNSATVGTVNQLAERLCAAEEQLNVMNIKFAGQNAVDIVRNSRPASGSAGMAGSPGGADLADLSILVNTHSSMIDTLFADKAGRDAVARLASEMADLKGLLGDYGTGFGGGGGGWGGSSGGDENAERMDMIRAALSDHERRLKALDGFATKDDMEAKLHEFAVLLETIQLNKADASIVAGKAEREYVENALEKLRREVEQVMNSTNSGLIDTLDKSLNILRDMIDGKANTADMVKLRDAWLLEHKKDDTPEGLAGYKHYRCLSCNRKMDGMRPRPMGMNFQSFMSHLPNPRVKQYKGSGGGGMQSMHLLPASSQATAKAVMASVHGEDYGGLPPLGAPAEYGHAPPSTAPALESGPL